MRTDRRTDTSKLIVVFRDLKIIKFRISRISFQLKPSCSMRTDRRTDTSKLVFRDLKKKALLYRHYLGGKNVESNLKHLKHQDLLDFTSNCSRSEIYHKVGAWSVGIRHRCTSIALEGTVSYPSFRATLLRSFKAP